MRRQSTSQKIGLTMDKFRPAKQRLLCELHNAIHASQRAQAYSLRQTRLQSRIAPIQLCYPGSSMVPMAQICPKFSHLGGVQHHISVTHCSPCCEEALLYVYRRENSNSVDFLFFLGFKWSKANISQLRDHKEQCIVQRCAKIMYCRRLRSIEIYMPV